MYVLYWDVYTWFLWRGQVLLDDCWKANLHFSPKRRVYYTVKCKGPVGSFDFHRRLDIGLKQCADIYPFMAEVEDNATVKTTGSIAVLTPQLQRNVH